MAGLCHSNLLHCNFFVIVVKLRNFRVPQSTKTKKCVSGLTGIPTFFNFVDSHTCQTYESVLRLVIFPYRRQWKMPTSENYVVGKYFPNRTFSMQTFLCSRCFFLVIVVSMEGGFLRWMHYYYSCIFLCKQLNFSVNDEWMHLEGTERPTIEVEVHGRTYALRSISNNDCGKSHVLASKSKHGSLNLVIKWWECI